MAWKAALPSSTFGFLWKRNFEDKQDLMNYVTRSLQNGFSPVARFIAGKIQQLPYYGSSYPYGGHYISIIADDSNTGKVVLSDCNWYENYYGIHVISDDTLFATFNEITYCVSN